VGGSSTGGRAGICASRGEEWRVRLPTATKNNRTNAHQIDPHHHQLDAQAQCWCGLPWFLPTVLRSNVAVCLQGRRVGILLGGAVFGNGGVSILCTDDVKYVASAAVVKR